MRLADTCSGGDGHAVLCSSGYHSGNKVHWSCMRGLHGGDVATAACRVARKATRFARSSRHYVIICVLLGAISLCFAGFLFGRASDAAVTPLADKAVCSGVRTSRDAIIILAQKKHSTYDATHSTTLQHTLRTLERFYSKLSEADVLIWHEGDMTARDAVLSATNVRLCRLDASGGWGKPPGLRAVPRTTIWRAYNPRQQTRLHRLARFMCSKPSCVLHRHWTRARTPRCSSRAPASSPASSLSGLAPFSPSQTALRCVLLRGGVLA